MRQGIGIWAAFAFLTAVMVLAMAPAAAAQVVEELPNGKIDWEEGYVYGKAAGSADMSRMKSEVQAEEVARTTGRHLAIRNVAETIFGVRISSKSIYRQACQEDDILRVETEGVVANPHVWKEEFSWTPRREPRADVIVRVPIYGGLSRVVSGWVERQTAKAPGPAVYKPAAQAPVEAYTGLIVDAGGKGIKPVMVPRVLTGTSGGVKEVYGPAVADKLVALEKGFAGYARSLDGARKNERVGANPLVVKAQRSDGALAGDMVISEEDAGKVVGANAKAEFLKQCKVVIVVN